MSNLELRGLKGLRNLDSLVSDSTAPKFVLEQIEKLPIEFLISGKYQPRKHFDETTLSDLVDSIKSQGVIQPLIVREIQDRKYEIVAGERRWRAAKIAGLTHVPAIIKEIEDKVALAFALIENIQRQDLNPMEEALAFARFKDEFSMTHEEIAHMLGRSRTSVTNTIRLLALSAPVRKLLEEGGLDMGHARALLTLDPALQIQAALKIADQKLSVREAERLVNTIKFLPSHKAMRSISFDSNKCKSWTQELSNKFSANVSVKLNDKGAGKIIIQVDSPDQIEWILNHINDGI